MTRDEDIPGQMSDCRKVENKIFAFRLVRVSGFHFVVSTTLKVARVQEPFNPICK